MTVSDDCRALLGPLVEGRLCFDIGAHIGTHTETMLELGASQVVAVEPLPWEAAKIADDPRLELLAGTAVSDVGGKGMIQVGRETYVSSLEPSYPLRVQQHAVYDYIGGLEVERVTLDWLIARYGLPGFVKIDVEGHELAVLNGLNVPLRALSFEVHDFDREKAERCLDRLQCIAFDRTHCRYDFFYSPREDYTVEPWTPRMELAIFGDIYAIRRPLEQRQQENLTRRMEMIWG